MMGKIPFSDLLMSPYLIRLGTSSSYALFHHVNFFGTDVLLRFSPTYGVKITSVPCSKIIAFQVQTSTRQINMHTKPDASMKEKGNQRHMSLLKETFLDFIVLDWSSVVTPITFFLEKHHFRLIPTNTPAAIKRF